MKYWFPNLEETIVGKGWTKEEFKQNAHNVSNSPSAKGWSLLMKNNHGMTGTYKMKAEKILIELVFSTQEYLSEEVE